MPSLGDEALSGDKRDLKAEISPEARQGPGEVPGGEERAEAPWLGTES